jgi:Uma2 family endonuclease
MADYVLNRDWILDMETFHGFRDDRPKEEKWELIDGRPVMMPPPSLVHQRICRNLETLLNVRLIAHRPEWAADREIGLLIPQDQKFNPEPDVTVIDAQVEMGQLYAERFYFVAEVLSGSDKPWVLKAKLDYYQRHDLCQSVLFVHQDQIAAEFYARASGWQKTDITNPTARLDIPGIGDIGALCDLYRHTPLALQA